MGDAFYRDVYIRDGKDFYTVYHPEEGRMERVSKHRRNVSEVAISEDAAYREDLLARYRAKLGPALPTPAPEVSSPRPAAPASATRTLDGDLVKYRQQLKGLAEFESQLAHWKTLPEDVRVDIQAGLYETLAQRTARRSADREHALAKLDELDGTKAVVQDQLASAARERASAVQQAQLEDNSDFYLNAYENSKGYVQSWSLYYDECENLRSFPTLWYTEDPSLYNAALTERFRTDQKIGAAEDSYAQQASVFGSQLSKVERAMTQQVRAAKAAVAKSIDEQRRFGDKQSRAAALAEASAADYQPRLRALPINTWRGMASGKLPEFTVGAGIWQLACTLSGAGSEDDFAVTLYHADTGQPFTRIAGADFLGMRTRIFDEPGRYYVVVEQGLLPLTYVVEVNALELR
ncbi:MAG: hypothetical protein IT368_02780 [Candidatus Hydrogenedentes bacterium]|nr:hypothetical protein [Candidatus Hydrogenedentota bacterium]